MGTQAIETGLPVNAIDSQNTCAPPFLVVGRTPSPLYLDVLIFACNFSARSGTLSVNAFQSGIISHVWFNLPHTDDHRHQ